MEPIYRQTFTINDSAVDRYGRLKPSMILFYAQEVAGQHCNQLSVDYDTLAQKRMFWAVIRHKVQVTRLPQRNETITVETWPMPTTRSAFPRSVVAYDENGNECFRSISLWVLMDLDSRNMILPGKSGITVSGTLRGTELTTPASLHPAILENASSRKVCFTDLDRNGHMNNTRYLDWIADLLPSAFHEAHPVREFTVCYLSEAIETQELKLSWQLLDGPVLQVHAHREKTDVAGAQERVFSALVQF